MPDLNRSQINALQVLIDDLSLRRDLSDGAKADLIAARLAGYRERNAERADRRQASDLERRAHQTRVDYGRADQLRHYSGEVAAGRAKPPPQPVAPPTPAQAVAHYRLDCIDCSREMRPYRAEPRVPLCPACARKRTMKKQKVTR